MYSIGLDFHEAYSHITVMDPQETGVKGRQGAEGPGRLFTTRTRRWKPRGTGR